MMTAEIEQYFGNCKFQHKCLCSTKSSFEFTDEQQFYIYDEKDSERPVQFVSSRDDFQLTINNKDGKLICLIKTDNCLLTDSTRKCDCILFDNEKFFFIEIKSFNKKGRRQNRKEAIEQLAITIKLFNKIINKTILKIAAIICFKQIEPRISSASANTARAIFLDNYNVRLEERNYISF